MGKQYQSKFQTFPIPFFDRDFYAAKTYLFLEDLYELPLMNRNAFIKKMFAFSTANFKISIFRGRQVAFCEQATHNVPSEYFLLQKPKENVF